MAESAPDAFAPNCHGLVSHHLRSHSQPITSGRFDRHPKVRGVATFGRHLTHHHRRMGGWQGICLHNYRWSRFAVIASCRNRHDISAVHCPSNTETASIQFRASNSCDRSSPATCFATRLRTDLERASGTTRRNSRRPRALRRSRMAFIRAAGNAIESSDVTRYSVTRYITRSKFETDNRIVAET